MEINIPIFIYSIYILIALLIQAGIDTLYTFKLIKISNSRRFAILLLAGSIGYLLSILIAFFLYQFNAEFLVNARNEVTFFAIAVLGVVLEYVLFGAIYATVKGYTIKWILLEDADEETLGNWWGYNNLGTITSLILLAPIFFVTYLLPALVGNVNLN